MCAAGAGRDYFAPLSFLTMAYTRRVLIRFKREVLNIFNIFTCTLITKKRSIFGYFLSNLLPFKSLPGKIIKDEVARSATHFLVRVSDHEDNAVAPQKHFADLAVLVDGLRLLFPAARLRHFGPHFPHVLEHHVAMPVERLHPREQLVVIAAVNEHLRVFLHRPQQQR